MANLRTGRRSGLVFRGGRSRRETQWLDSGTFSVQLASDLSAVLTNSLGAVPLALRPFTIVRTRGILSLQSDQQAATESPQASFGMAIVSEQAVAIGITAVPTPVTDRGSDLWFVYESMFAEWTFSSAVGSQSFLMTRAVDSKAMRKVEDGEDMVFVAESDSAEGSIIQGTFRLLIKLH